MACVHNVECQNEKRERYFINIKKVNFMFTPVYYSLQSEHIQGNNVVQYAYNLSLRTINVIKSQITL